MGLPFFAHKFFALPFFAQYNIFCGLGIYECCWPNLDSMKFTNEMYISYLYIIIYMIPERGST